MEKNKKRLIFFMPSIEGGGVEKNLILISNYITKFCVDVSLITFDNNFNKYFNKKIRIISVVKKKRKKISKYLKYFFCICLLIREYVINRNFVLISFQANIYVIILSYFLKFKIISRSNSSPSGWSKSHIKNFIFKFFFKRADCIIVNSKQFQLEFKKKFNISTKLIYNPLNKNEIIKKSKLKYNKNVFSKNTLKIINIARLTKQKDHLTLIKALNIIKKEIKFNLLLIGYGSQKSAIKNKIDVLKMQNSIKLIGYKSNPFPYLKASNLFILSSKYEGLPNVILESQTLKKYVISSSCPTGPKEILMNGKLGSLFKVGDYKKLALLILDFNKNKKKYQKTVNLAFKNLYRFDYELNCRKYLKIIKEYL